MLHYYRHMNAQKTSTLFGCSEAQAKAQMQRNLDQLGTMLCKAETTGKKVNGYTTDELRDMIAKVKKGWNL